MGPRLIEIAYSGPKHKGLVDVEGDSGHCGAHLGVGRLEVILSDLSQGHWNHSRARTLVCDGALES